MTHIEFEKQFKKVDGGYLERGQSEVYSEEYTKHLIKEDEELHGVKYENVPDNLREA